MTGIVFLAFVAVLVVLGRLCLRLGEAESKIRDLLHRLQALETGLRFRPGQASPASKTSEESADVASAATQAPVSPPAPVLPPPLPVAAAWAPKPPVHEKPLMERDPALQPFRKANVSQETAAKSEEPSRPAVNLEAFMGVKLFAWLGGLALFLGVVFFVKYSFDHNLITPQMRVGIGTLTGLGLIAGGLLTPRPKFAVTAQTLCATGVVILYGVTYAAYAVYHLLDLTPAFACMAAMTFAAFLLAVRLNAQVVAVLGLLGGFLTPFLLSTGQQNPSFLFTYLGVLDVGLIAVALRQRWHYLVTLAAVATALLQLTELAGFLPGDVGRGTFIFLGFEALFLVPFWLCNRDEAGDAATTAASAVSAGMALLFAAAMLGHSALGRQPWICLSIALAADTGLVVWPLRRRVLAIGPCFGGAALFLILSAWNLAYLNQALLKWGLGYFLLFAAFHAALPIILQRLRPAPAASFPRWIQIFPALCLILMLWPAFHIGASVDLWVAVLIVDVAAIFLAARTASPLGVVAALVLTLATAALWLAQTPVEAPELGGLLSVIAGFAILFCGASLLLQKQLGAGAAAGAEDSADRQALEHLPSLSVVMPFALLISAVLRLHPGNPAAIFGVGLFLVMVILGLARWSRSAVLPPVAFVCASLLEYCWRTDTYGQAWGWPSLGWYLAFSGAILAFPFLAESRKTVRSAPWVTAALAPVLHYPLIAETIRHAWPQFWHSAGGLVPAALALPVLGACFHLRRRIPAGDPARLMILAWFGGVALLFITLIFPTQFEHESLTLSWALEGVALLWLFHRLPHAGLRAVGFGLLCVAFVRLSLNPAVLTYHARSGIPIWNWYLYTYGVAAACFFVAALLAAPPRDRLGGVSLPVAFNTLGTILLFFLLNIEIADFFSTSETLTFDFQGNLARDMTYSIAWSLFALVLLLVGMHRRVAGIRYAGIGLLIVTLAKLFLHDLANLDQLYRIGAFVAVSVVLIGASYLYQRFLAIGDEPVQNHTS